MSALQHADPRGQCGPRVKSWIHPLSLGPWRKGLWPQGFQEWGPGPRHPADGDGAEGWVRDVPLAGRATSGGTQSWSLSSSVCRGGTAGRPQSPVPGSGLLFAPLLLVAPLLVMSAGGQPQAQALGWRGRVLLGRPPKRPHGPSGREDEGGEGFPAAAGTGDRLRSPHRLGALCPRRAGSGSLASRAAPPSLGSAELPGFCPLGLGSTLWLRRNWAWGSVPAAQGCPAATVPRHVSVQHLHRFPLQSPAMWPPGQQAVAISVPSWGPLAMPSWVSLGFSACFGLCSAFRSLGVWVPFGPQSSHL